MLRDTVPEIMHGNSGQTVIAIVLPILVIAVIFFVYLIKQKPKFWDWVLHIVQSISGLFFNKAAELPKDKQFSELLKTAGYVYDAKQDIFYSDMDAWQREVGYCRLYDEAAAPMGMIIDCEPIYFEYEGKRWMIEFWKGQYDMAAGCEVGVYNTDRQDVFVPGIFKGAFYNCAKNDDRLQIAYTVKKKGKKLFKRDGLHWWLTGFVVGTFCNPSDITLDIRITLKSAAMRRTFVDAMMKAGYTNREIRWLGKTVWFTFDRPRTPQPVTRTADMDAFMQAKNKVLCDAYQKTVKGLKTLPEKTEALRKHQPMVYERLQDIGKSKAVFDAYKTIKVYLG